MSIDEPVPRTPRGTQNQQVGRAGEHFVVAELNKRGAHAVNFAGNMPRIDLMACNKAQDRTVGIQVKTRRGGRSWQASTKAAQPCSPQARNGKETSYWVLVDLGDLGESPRYWIVPERWMCNDIHEAHQKYLAKHGGKRARNQESTHHKISEERVAQWQGKWEVLGLW